MDIATPSVELLGEQYIQKYYRKVELANNKLRTLQEAFAGSRQELEFGLTKFISYMCNGSTTHRFLHNVFGELKIPYSYATWDEFDNVDVTIIDVKNHPFMVIFRGKQSLTNIRGNNNYGAET